MSASPPRLAVLLLETLLPMESRDAVVGDLVEAFERRTAGRKAWPALRFWRESLAAIAQLQFVPALESAFTPQFRESLVQSILSDLRYGARVLARARGFTALCISILGLAIGATTAIYSIVNPVLLRSLPYPNPDRLSLIFERERDGTPTFIGYTTYQDLRRDARTLERAAVFGFWEPTIFGERDAERISGQVVTWEYFRTLGVRPALGRDFDVTEDTPETRNVVILSHGLWMRRYGGDSSALGSMVNMGTVSRRIVGIMPASFDNALSPTAEIWRPLGYRDTDPWACRTCRHLQMITRVRPGVSSESMHGEITGLMARIVQRNPRDYASVGVVTPGLQERVTRNARPILLALMGAALLVLLIAAANVVNLQLARALRRQEEFAVRAALGAGRGRITRQLLAEGVLLAALGATAGVLMAITILPLLVGQLPETLPRLSAIGVDWAALLFVAGITTLVGVAIGLVPAFSAGRTRLFDTLRAGGRSAIGFGRHRIRATLVVAEVALALMLVIGASLLGRSLIRLLDVDPGFDETHMLTLQVQATGPRYDTDESIYANHDRILAAVRAVPGVTDAALATQLPLAGNIDRYGVWAQDKPLENPELAPSADRYTVSTDFLRTMRIPLLRGRTFTAAEVADSNVQVAIVSDALAKRIWPGEDAVGKYIRLGEPTRPWKQVIGIAGDIRHSGLEVAQTLQVYLPERHSFGAQSVMMLAVRTSGDPAALTSAVYNAVREVDPLQPVTKVATMERVVAQSTAQRRLGVVLFLAFGGIALILAAAGIYGVLAGSVEERTREFGVRSALGATPVTIVSLVLKSAGRLAGVGIALGAGGAVLLSGYLRTLLYGIEPTDPMAAVLAVSVVSVVVVVACLIPARRAVRVDPMTALRAD
jgi:putative ABC transport system permease protein